MIALVSCLETFYRDLFRLLLESHPQSASQQRKVSKKKLDELLQAGLHPNDVSVEFIGLQNAKNITDTLDQYFPPNGYISALSEGLTCKVPNKSPNIILFQLDSKWPQRFDELFEVRHRYVHDANSRSDMSVEAIRELETLVILLPQLTTWRLSSPAHKLASKKGDLNYLALLIVDDLVRDDWEFVEGNDENGRSIGLIAHQK